MTNYEIKLKNEVSHWENQFRDRMHIKGCPIWSAVENHFAQMLFNNTGVRNLYNYVSRHVKSKTKVSILGLGSGACGNELDGIAPLLKQFNCVIELTCVDIGEGILHQAKSEAQKRNINFIPIVKDVNTIVLDKNRYDVIVAYAALHHFVELDYISEQINKALKPDGIFVTVDIPTRNGYLMWDETSEIVRNLWSIIPPKYKIDHTRYAEPQYSEEFPDIDYSVDTFECINSESILPALYKHLKEIDYVPALSMSRRFFDTKFGPNYDINNQFDMNIFNFIISLDDYYLHSGILKPETFFGAYSKKV
jgi:SAM-dependent methyltransferase